MIEGPLSGASSAEAASQLDLDALIIAVANNATAIGTKAAESALTTAEGEIASLQTSVAAKANATDVATLSSTVAGNVTAIATKADGGALTTAEGTLVTHTGQIAGLNSSFNNIGNSFYTKSLTDALLSGKQATIGDGDLTVARTNGLQSAIDAKQATITGTFSNALSTFATPVVCNFDLECQDLTAATIYGGAATQITSAISTATALCVPYAYGATLGAHDRTSETGTWSISATSTNWSGEHRLHPTGYAFTSSSGSNTTASETITFTFPAGFVGGTAYLNHL